MPEPGGQEQDTETTGRTVADVVHALQQRREALTPDRAHRAQFLETYTRTTSAVGVAVEQGFFEDGAWVSRWDVVFADLYLRAHDAELTGGPVPRPWRAAFAASPELHPLQHLLLGINAHINYDLPQALLMVISPQDFADEEVLQRRRRDHERIDHILRARVRAEDAEIRLVSRLRWQDRALTPLNRAASKRFLQESRRKVWLNTFALHEARLAGPDTYAERLAELELLSAARIADFVEPGPVLLRLAIGGFGVTLPPPA
jgi:hypothetical protein